MYPNKQEQISEKIQGPGAASLQWHDSTTVRCDRNSEAQATWFSQMRANKLLFLGIPKIHYLWNQITLLFFSFEGTYMFPLVSIMVIISLQNDPINTWF